MDASGEEFIARGNKLKEGRGGDGGRGPPNVTPPSSTDDGWMNGTHNLGEAEREREREREATKKGTMDERLPD